MTFEVALPELAFFIVGVIVLNVLVWVVAWSRAWGKICQRIDDLEKKVDDHIDDKRCHDSEGQKQMRELLNRLDAKLELICGDG
jgi:hypothetical protein